MVSDEVVLGEIFFLIMFSKIPIYQILTMFDLPGCKFRSPVAWSITAQSSPAERTTGDCLLGM